MTPEQEQVLFYHELGKALSQWAYVELDLRHLVTACVPMDARQLVAVGYFSIENFRSKLAYCDSIIVESMHRSTAFKRWAAVSERVKSASIRRNRLAHWTVMFYPRAKTGRRYALVDWPRNAFSAPSKQDPDRNASGPSSSSICLHQILEARYDFESLTPTLSNLRTAFLGEREPWSDSDCTPATPLPPAAHWKKFCTESRISAVLEK